MKKKLKFETGFLFSTPSLISGAGSIFNLAGNYFSYNTSNNGDLANKTAIHNDFAMIGQDLFKAMEDIKKSK